MMTGENSMRKRWAIKKELTYFQLYEMARFYLWRCAKGLKAFNGRSCSTRKKDGGRS